MGATQLTGKQIKDGGVDIVDLNATGTASSSTFLRGDGSWQAVSGLTKDADNNISVNNVVEGYATTASSAGTLTLTVASAADQYITGTTTHTVQLPAATTLSLGHCFCINNRSTGAVTVKDGGTSTIFILPPNGTLWVQCIGISSAAGVWDCSTSGTFYTVSRVSGSNATTTSTTLVDVTGLSNALAANTVYEVEVFLKVASSATGAIQHGLQFSSTGASLSVNFLMPGSATGQVYKLITAFNTATTGNATAVGTDNTVLAKGWVRTGANAGNLTVQHLKGTSGTATVYIDSYLKTTPIQ